MTSWPIKTHTSLPQITNTKNPSWSSFTSSTWDSHFLMSALNSLIYCSPFLWHNPPPGWILYYLCSMTSLSWARKNVEKWPGGVSTNSKLPTHQIGHKHCPEIIVYVSLRKSFLQNPKISNNLLHVLVTFTHLASCPVIHTKIRSHEARTI